ncbi:MAG: hypothetical protein ACI8Q1_001246 [Parvicella sp.]|jgi:hypothetical protein
MPFFLKRLLQFTFTCIVIGLLLLSIDLFVYDRVKNNPFIQNVIENSEIADIIFIGSSKFYYHHVDSLIEPEATYLSRGGQYSYAAISVLKLLEKGRLLDEKLVFLDLQDNDELTTGFGDWWYFSESFVQDKTASLFDYSMRDWPRIVNRIIVDVTEFGSNSSSSYSWIPYESESGREARNVDAVKLQESINDFNSEETQPSFSATFKKSLVRLNEYLDFLEEEYNCKVLITLAPVPKNGSLRELKNIFPDHRLLNLTNLITDNNHFQDNYHFNAKGAAEFSKKLNVLVNEIVSNRELLQR